MDKYLGAGVPEYWVVELQKERVNVFTLTDGEFDEEVKYTFSDTVPVRSLPGLSIKVSDFL